MAKVLVIDDDSVVRDTIVRVLERKGYAVVVAENGARGLRLFRSEQPDLVITDLIMPDKEGLETIIDIRREYPDAKIVAISGGGRVGNADYLMAAKKLGAFDTISKPFDPVDLLSCVGRCLDSARPN